MAACQSVTIFASGIFAATEKGKKMREILFRGKRIDNGEWVEGSLLKVTIDGKTAHLIFGDNFCFVGNDVKAMSHALVDPSTVGQYTGLKDKNGKRIFEGDIIRMEFVDTEEVGEIVWDEERCKWAYASPDGDIYGVDGTIECEIIGNIHDAEMRRADDE